VRRTLHTGFFGYLAVLSGFASYDTYASFLPARIWLNQAVCQLSHLYFKHFTYITIPIEKGYPYQNKKFLVSSWHSWQTARLSRKINAS